MEDIIFRILLLEEIIGIYLIISLDIIFKYYSGYDGGYKNN